VLSLTLFVAPASVETALAVQRRHEGVRNVIRVPGAAVETEEDLVAAAVAPAAADDVLDHLRDAGVCTDRCTLSRRGVDLVEIDRTSVASATGIAPPTSSYGTTCSRTRPRSLAWRSAPTSRRCPHCASGW
jgi:hypothetical protein